MPALEIEADHLAAAGVRDRLCLDVERRSR
jgi:hypothetical protein